MSELHAIVRFKVNEGKLDEFKRLAARCLEIVRTKDPGTVRYDWFFSADQSEGVVQESYRSSEDFLEHGQNLREALEALRGVASLSSEMLGTPSPELTRVLESRHVRTYQPFQSK